MCIWGLSPFERLCMLFWMNYVWPGGSVSLTNQLLCLLQLDQLVVDAAKEKRVMEQKHSTIQQKVHSHNMVPASLRLKNQMSKAHAN